MTHPRRALLIDFGSTYTKLRAVGLDEGRMLESGQGPSTVTTDITVGMTAALDDLGKRMGGLPPFQHRLASSSAAGGLRMVTVGLVKELTAEAARQAALGAGAKLVGAFAYRLTASDMAEIAALEPDILLLAGGTDGGNAEVILHNAGALARSPLRCPIVVAGNRSAADDIRPMLAETGAPVSYTENVMPEFGELNIEPARAAIRQIFIDRIVHAKGIDRAAAQFDAVLMPTPAAVLEGARLLADGTGDRDGLGPLTVVDVGGATTDVHSVASGEPTQEGVVPQGLPEPYVKRTVEGDLGMRHNARHIVESAGAGAMAAAAGMDEAAVEKMLAAIARDLERLPRNARERRFDAALARAAVQTAMARHAGTAQVVQTVTGPVTVQRGKDLTTVDTIIGTGGALVYSEDPADILAAALADPREPFSLRPRAPRLYVDSAYILYAVGLLGTVEPGAALALGLGALRRLTPSAKEESDEPRLANG
jgi:uncharacterized protein (TIGR01319 family)